MEGIEIKNEIIRDKIYLNLKKNFSEILTEEELKDFDSITLNAKDFKQNEIIYEEEDYKVLKYINSIALNGFIIDDQIIKNLNYLKDLSSIIFNHCIFENNTLIESNIESLWITYSNVKNLKLFQNFERIKKMTFIEVGEIDIKEIINIKNIEELAICNSFIKNSIMINDFKNLKELKLDGSLVDEKNFLELLNKDIKLSYKEKYFVGL